MNKSANTHFPIHALLKQRWSPRAFADRPVEKEKLQRLFEAARWAPSCFNEQPWVFILTTKANQEEYDNLLSCLVEGNRIWAQHAPLLLLTVAKMHFDHNGELNRHAFHDIGLAIGNLLIQATAMDLVLHQMAGILPDRIRELYALPQGFEPVTGIAIGYQGDAKSLPEPFKERELTPRSRKAVKEWVFSGTWGRTPEFLRSMDSGDVS
ncbi:MAG: nitroreductase family protein [Nitrospirales bacterium]